MVGLLAKVTPELHLTGLLSLDWILIHEGELAESIVVLMLTSDGLNEEGKGLDDTKIEVEN